MTLTINLSLIPAVLITAGCIFWLLFVARVNDGYIKPAAWTVSTIAIVWVIWGVMQ